MISERKRESKSYLPQGEIDELPKKAIESKTPFRQGGLRPPKGYILYGDQAKAGIRLPGTLNPPRV